MGRRKPTRTPSGASSIYRGADGFWHGRVTVGVQDDGRPDRRHVMGKKQADVVRKVRELEKLRDAARVPKAGQRWTVATWLTYWIDNIAVPPHIGENSHSGYRVDVEQHLIPGIGAHRLEKLAPEHVERLYAKIQRSGLSAGTAHHVHRTLRAALNEAVRRSQLPRNPVLLAKAPKLAEQDVEPYAVEEIQRLLRVVSGRRNGARWVVALALGLRQGEALGLKWSDVDLDSGLLRIRRGRLRPRYAHGCGGTCGRKAGYCPQRKQVRPDAGDTKSRAGRRTIGLPDPLITLLKAHKQHQDTERQTAQQMWHDQGWVFARPDGRPLSPNTDYHEWKNLLAEAGLRDTRLHDARHTAATVLLILGVPTSTAMALMGWSSPAMAKRYQHLIDVIRRDVAKQLGGLLWDQAEEAPSVGEDAGARAAGQAWPGQE
jgi:integrase